MWLRGAVWNVYTSRMASAVRLICLCLILNSLLGLTTAYSTEHELRVGEKVTTLRRIDKALEIYCYPPQPKQIIHLWRTVSVSVSIPSDKYESYVGSAVADVREQYESDQSYFKFNIFSSKNQKIMLHPFNGSCLGIYTDAAYRVDFWKVLMLAGGITLFGLAPKLSHNVFFYYLCGMTVGVFASVLLILFIFSKLLPRKPAMVMFLVGGWTVSVYLLQLLWSNLNFILLEYPSFVIGYTSLASFISFVICYRFGPVTDPRSKNLIKWTLQVVSLGLIFFSSERKRFPPKVRLLSESEFIEEGVVETKKALHHLRKHCSSPECNTWKTVLRLKDPLRFASFIEGSPHISDDEILNYERDSEVTLTELLTEESESESEIE
ncbi:hypothetical protein J437_LFUL002328 [Ladona fulva]|uniref:Nuclear envelope integral membrane protein 1 n=1 Tax=Ladona fulva TaxID=123851 RepID=A0A8K0K8P7_LADFU|nr:hypothetical protein J437_LFUL002328 [Ladona fulva]